MSQFQVTTLFSDLLRLITPEEINELTTEYSGDKRVSLTSLANSELFGIQVEEHKEQEDPSSEDGEKAKILPLSNAENGNGETPENSSVPMSLRVGEGCGKLLAQNSPHGRTSISSMTSAAPDLDEDVEVITERKGASLFLVEEKSQLEDSRRKLKEKDIIKTYNKVSSVQVDSQKVAQKAYRKVSSMGVLVNKKHE